MITLLPITDSQGLPSSCIWAWTMQACWYMACSQGLLLMPGMTCRGMHAGSSTDRMTASKVPMEHDLHLVWEQTEVCAKSRSSPAGSYRETKTVCMLVVSWWVRICKLEYLASL